MKFGEISVFMTADEQKVLAIVKSSENYVNLSASLSPVFSEINEL
jgi:hypothetical protein